MRAKMAATLFSSTSFRYLTMQLLLLLALLFFKQSLYVSLLPNKDYFSTKESMYCAFLKCSWKPISTWQKHGIVCLFLPMEELTLCMDSELNPGPTVHDVHPSWNSTPTIFNRLTIHPLVRLLRLLLPVAVSTQEIFSSPSLLSVL